MIKYEDIKKANETIKTTNIKGKEYAEVNQRIKAFRMVYPEGFIDTNMISCENGVCIIRAEVGFFENGQSHILGAGTAYEKENSTFINKTSYIENCETSAVGRALGMAGFGIDVSVASAEEVINAINNQNDKKMVESVQAKPIDEIKIKIINDAVGNVITTDQLKKTLSHYKVKAIAELNEAQACEIINRIKELKGE
jgi:hypothetical protein